MAEVITRFKLETTQYDSALRNESQRLAEFARKARDAGDQFGKFADKNAEAARALGNMATSATNSKDKVKELVGAYNEFARQYNALTKEQQQSDFTKAMAESLTVLKGRIAEAKQELYGLDAAAKQVKTDVSGGDFDQLIGGIAGKFGMSASMFTGVGAAVAAAGTAFKLVKDNIETAMGFERSMSQLSALTGMVGKDLDKLKEYAIELGSTTTLTASQVADAFRLIGSQQPQLLESGEALKEVTKYAITLSEAAGIDLVTASQTLSTSINQMGGDSKNAARYVNVLAAASQKGAGDIAWLGEAIVKSGTYAKAVGTSYEELTANLETLAKAGYDASTAGTALRSIILALEKQADNELKPSVVGLTDAFENLGKKQLDISGYASVVNQRFAAQALTLAENVEQTRTMTDAITGTNIAEQQATTNVDNLSGAIKQLSSAWEGLNLHINDSNSPITTFVNEISETIRQVDVLVRKFNELKDSIPDNQVINDIKDQLSFGMKSWVATIPGMLPIMGGKWLLDQFVPDPAKQQQQRTRHNQGEFVNPLSADKYNLVKDLQEQENGWNGVSDAIKNTSDNIVVFSGATNKAKTDLKSLVDDTNSTAKSLTELQNELKTLKKLRDEAANKGNTELRDQYNKQIADVQKEIKTLRGGTTTPNTSKQTPQDRAANIVQSAQESYAHTMIEASLRMESGLDNEEAYKKKELAAHERLFEAYGKAYSMYADPRYKAAYDEAADAYKKLATKVKTTADEATKSKLKNDTFNARTENNLKDFYAATSKLQALGIDEPLVPDAVKVDVMPNIVKSIWSALPEELKKSMQKVEVPFSFTTANLDAFIAKLKQDIAKADVGSELSVKLNAQLADATALSNLMQTAVKNGIDTAQFNPQELWEKIFGDNPGDYIDDTTWQTIVDKINEYMKDHPVELDFTTGAVKTNVNTTESKQKDTSVTKEIGQMAGGIQSIVGGIENLGVELPDGLKNVVSGIQNVTTILTGISAILSVIETITAADAAIPFFAQGGVVRAAGGWSGVVPGNHLSGDQVPALVNSGETILTAAQAGNLNTMLQDGSRGVQTQSYVEGEKIWLGVNNFLRRSGRGEIVTSRR